MYTHHFLVFSTMAGKLVFLQFQPQMFWFRIVRKVVADPAPPPPLLTFLVIVPPLPAAGGLPATVPVSAGLGIPPEGRLGSPDRLLHPRCRLGFFLHFPPAGCFFHEVAFVSLFFFLLEDSLHPSPSILPAAFSCPGGSPCCSWPS